MKTIIIKIALLAGLGMAGLTSCNKQLDLAPISSISDDNYWKTPDQFDAFVTALHTRFRSHIGNFLYLGELRAGNFGNDPGTTASFTGEASQGLERMWMHNLDMDNPGVGNFGGFYDQINQLNLLINKIGSSTVISDANKNYYLGIAHGMRAFYYFQLYRTWGNVVIQTDATFDIDIANLAKKASPAAEVMALIKADLETSIASFGTDYTIRSTRSIWSKAATLMLKAEVYLWTAHRGGGGADATLAKNALTEVKSNMDVQLQPSYASIFDVTGKATNKEMIFAVRHQLNEATLGFIGSFVPQAGLIANFYDSLANRKFTVTQENYGGILRVPTRIATYRNYNDQDTRKNVNIQAAYTKLASGPYQIAGCFLKKYQGQQDAGTRAYTNDYPIYRYADLLLLMAEAKVVIGESPADEINLVRARAYGSNYNLATLGFPNQAIDAQPMEAILKERNLEFFGEGKYWYDMRRMGDAFVFKYSGLSSAEAYKLLWPIDRSSLTNNRELEQTPGYPKF